MTATTIYHPMAEALASKMKRVEGGYIELPKAVYEPGTLPNCGAITRNGSRTNPKAGYTLTTWGQFPDVDHTEHRTIREAKLALASALIWATQPKD